MRSMEQEAGFHPTTGVVRRLSVRGRLFALAIGIAVLGAICVVVALSGLIDQGTKVQTVDTKFTDFRAERDAYEGWLTADDQMNMFAALAALKDPSQRALENTTWGQVVSGHAQAIQQLNWLSAHATDPALRHAAQATLSDVHAYYG